MESGTPKGREIRRLTALKWQFCSTQYHRFFMYNQCSAIFGAFMAWGSMLCGTQLHLWGKCTFAPPHACNNMKNRGIYLVTVQHSEVNTLKSDFTDKIQYLFLSHFAAVKKIYILKNLFIIQYFCFLAFINNDFVMFWPRVETSVCTFIGLFLALKCCLLSLS